MGLPTIKDRLMQKCLEQLLAPYFENIFSAWNLGFRTKNLVMTLSNVSNKDLKGLTILSKLT
ncbi:hypothetical protein OC698_01465 ['Gossypium sp.' phytoplasma]|uniref:Uncharacterized protein n=1 Tax=Candidatus Phytoplasma gossypii TaxID=2982629 RepID=A0ABT9D174_9MOLU|nr:hypothetical protein ['Gossypium sp.' phytoplasma]MDO8057362.1 hypothetical protein ['Gossypium sp.' phytoplasma]